MTLADIKTQALFQFGSDTDVMDDYEYMPHIVDYANEAYDILMWAWKDNHVPDENLLKDDNDAPDLPDWAHRAIADYTTWMLYRNGNSARQNRGQAYLSNFNMIKNRLQVEKYGGVRNFYNIPD